MTWLINQGKVEEEKKKRQKKSKVNMKKEEEEEKKKQKADKEVEKKGPEEAPKGYIHVRARRGQATDSHSLAERVYSLMLLFTNQFFHSIFL